MTARRDDDRRDGGFSLVELIVAMAVLSVVMIIVTNLFVTVLTTTKQANTARSAVGEASNAMTELTGVLRMGSPNAVAGSPTASPAIVSGTASSVTVTSYIATSATAPMPTQVSFSLVGTSLQETRTASVASGSLAVFTGTTTTRIPATGLNSLSFSYADASGAALTPDPIAGLSAAQRALVSTVTVTVTTANTTGTRSDPVVITSAVLLTNVALANAGAS